MIDFILMGRHRFLVFLFFTFVVSSLLGLRVSNPAFSQTGYVRDTKKNYDEVLVLNNGQIVEGKITQDARGYEVEQKNRSRFLALYDHVAFQAENRHDAYLQMITRMPTKSAENHFKLATWCYSNEIYSEAITELRKVFLLETDHRSARKLMDLIEEKIAPTKKPVPSKTIRTFDNFLKSEAKSLAGLSPQSAKLFVSRIQPMLVKSCGASGCHSSRSEGNFRLWRLRRTGNNSYVTERNLAQILQYIEPQNPERSRLLQIPISQHANATRPIFQGSAGRKRYEILKTWVALIASNLENEGKKGNANRIVEGNSTNKLRYSSAPALQRIKDVNKIRSSMNANKKKSGDAFDPKLFNKSKSSTHGTPKSGIVPR